VPMAGASISHNSFCIKYFSPAPFLDLQSDICFTCGFLLYCAIFQKQFCFLAQIASLFYDR